MAIQVLERANGSVRIQCPFCRGEGVDPFGVMSAISRCPVCLGKKELKMREPLRECAFCGATGVHPHTRMTCTACQGRGAVTLKGPVETCPACQGSGASDHDGMPCTQCQGLGVVPKATAKVET